MTLKLVQGYQNWCDDCVKFDRQLLYTVSNFVVVVVIEKMTRNSEKMPTIMTFSCNIQFSCFDDSGNMKYKTGHQKWNKLMGQGQ